MLRKWVQLLLIITCTAFAQSSPSERDDALISRVDQDGVRKAASTVRVSRRCSDIRSVDFRNATIRPKQTPNNVFDFDLRFRNGTFDYAGSDAPDKSIVDWQFNIVRDKVVRNSSGEDIRFIEIFANHLMGTGSEEYLIGFRCSNGTVRNVFQENGEGMRVISLSAKAVHLRFGVWKDSDAHCCPSATKDVWFTWDGHSHSYVEERSESH